MGRLAVLASLLLLLIAHQVGAQPSPAPVAPPVGYFVQVFAEQDQKRLWALGTALTPGDRACITLGKVLGVNAPPAKDARHPTPGVQEVTLGLQLTVQLRHVKGTSYLLELWWSADGEIGRTERWIDRKTASQTTHLAGVVGTPQLIGLLHGIGGSPLTVHAQVDAR